MTDIKVGQVYDCKFYYDRCTNRFVISKIEKQKAFLIESDGRTFTEHLPIIDTYFNYLASYPTWQEAVNSPEFKGEKQ